MNVRTFKLILLIALSQVAVTAQAELRLKPSLPCAEFLAPSDEGQDYSIQTPTLMSTLAARLRGEKPKVVTVRIRGKKLTKQALSNIQLELADLYVNHGQTSYRVRELNHWAANSDGFIRFKDQGIEQIVRPLNADDHILLQYSDSDRKPTEFGRVRIYDMNGHVLGESGVFTSFHGSRIEGDSFNSGLIDARDKVKDRSQIAYIEFVHTHPIYELLGPEKNLDFPLSPADINLTRYFQAQFKRSQIVMTAVLPNGYAYSSFVNGETTPEQLRILATLR